MTAPRLDLYDLTRTELQGLFERWGVSPVHAARLWSYLYLELATSFDRMPDLPARVRTRLAAGTSIGTLPVALETDSIDGFTRKYLLDLADREKIETVLMRFTGRVTACLSSQVGCAMGCVFCATGQMGYTRNLTAGEIVAQAVHIARALRPIAAPTGPATAPAGPPADRRSGPRNLIRDPSSAARGGMEKMFHGSSATTPRLRNVVLMGMGEPLHNYEAVMQAIDILRDPNGLALAGERITLSTVGVVPGIRRLAAEQRPPHLAVSLHAATQEERAALVPVARKWPLDALIAACRAYSEQTGRRIFYEWALIAGKNDTPGHARAVGRLLRGLPAQVNLIPLNPTTGYDGLPTQHDAARRFQKILADEFALPSTVRQRRGIDIAAGCGQLATAG